MNETEIEKEVTITASFTVGEWLIIVAALKTGAENVSRQDRDNCWTVAKLIEDAL